MCSTVGHMNVRNDKFVNFPQKIIKLNIRTRDSTKGNMISIM